MTRVRKQELALFDALYTSVTEALDSLHADIDRLGYLGDKQLLGECDQLACFASNSLHGTKALLRELHAKAKERP
jgi:hypothetical protein